MNKLIRLEQLRSLYRSTFEEWVSQVGRLDQIRDSAHEGHALREIQGSTTTAEGCYREVRNQLAKEMVAGKEEK